MTATKHYHDEAQQTEAGALKLINRSLQFARGFLLSYGPRSVKREFWEREYHENKWHFAEDSAADCVYPHLAKHAKNGSILDLGCGSGNTANELADSTYTSYLGVDISEEALAKAVKRTAANGRSHKNRFVRSDFLDFETNEKFDVVLFRESMYHVPLERIKSLLDTLSAHLKPGGVFIVRMYIMRDGVIKFRPKKMIDIIASNYPVFEKNQYGNAGAVVVVFGPRHARHLS
jgi:2-polyprenyl-3-methyl-5-hydroxy-6-metoxy-1,4-benzoquinol methylase